MDIRQVSELRLIVHNQFGVIVMETWGTDEIAAAMEAVSDIRKEKRREVDCRESDNSTAA